MKAKKKVAKKITDSEKSERKFLKRTDLLIRQIDELRQDIYMNHAIIADLARLSTQSLDEHKKTFGSTDIAKLIRTDLHELHCKIDCLIKMGAR